jgi:hypothetical protein
MREDSFNPLSSEISACPTKRGGFQTRLAGDRMTRAHLATTPNFLAKDPYANSLTSLILCLPGWQSPPLLDE